jgi:hypothetical protein
MRIFRDSPMRVFIAACIAAAVIAICAAGRRTIASWTDFSRLMALRMNGSFSPSGPVVGAIALMPGRPSEGIIWWIRKGCCCSISGCGDEAASLATEG